MARVSVAQLEAEIAMLKGAAQEERSRSIQQRADLVEARKERDTAWEVARSAERENARLQGYIDRVREEQGARVGELEVPQHGGSYHPRRCTCHLL